MKTDLSQPGKNTIIETLYVILLVLNNIIAFYCISIAAIFHEFPYHKYTELEEYLLLALSGFMVSLFFSLISSAITFLFKAYFIPALTGQLKFFLIQLSFLFLIFGMEIAGIVLYVRYR